MINKLASKRETILSQSKVSNVGSTPATSTIFKSLLKAGFFVSDLWHSSHLRWSDSISWIGYVVTAQLGTTPASSAIKNY